MIHTRRFLNSGSTWLHRAEVDIRTQSSLFAAIVGLALGVAMLLRTQRPRVLTLFGLFALSVGAFDLARFLEGVFPFGSGTTGRIMLGASLLTAALVPSTALSFFLEFLNFSPRAARYGRRMSYFSRLPRPRGGRDAVGRHAVGPSGGVRVGALHTRFLGMAGVLAHANRARRAIDRLRLLYLAAGAGASVLFSGLDFLERLRQCPSPRWGPSSPRCYLFFLSQTLLRLRLMDLHELLGKIASQTCWRSILALVFVVLTAWVEGNTSLYLFNTLVAAFVMLILLEPLSRWVEERVVAFAFRQRFEFLEQARALQRRTANVIDVPQLAAMLLDGFNETRRVTHASLYLLAEDRPGFRLLDSRGPTPALFIDQGTSRALLLRSRARPAARDGESPGRRAQVAALRGPQATGTSSGASTTSAWRWSQMKAGITVPLVGNDRVLGFLNLWDERVPEAFASDEIALILELAEHFATSRRELQALREDARARPPGRAGRDGRRPGPRDPQPAGGHQGRGPVPRPPPAARRRGRVRRGHRRGGEPPQRRGDGLPRLRPAAQAELRAHRPQRGRHPHHPPHSERRAPAASACGTSWPRRSRQGRRRRRAAQAGAHQPGAERHVRHWESKPGTSSCGA